MTHRASPSPATALASAGIALLLAAGLVHSKDDASGVETILAKCEPEEVDPGTTSERYDIVIYAGKCPNGERTRSMPSSLPPEPVTMECVMGEQLWSTCLVWPHGEGLTYHWELIGPAQLIDWGGEEPDRSAEFVCFDSGTVKLRSTITSPYGLSTHYVVDIYCP